MKKISQNLYLGAICWNLLLFVRRKTHNVMRSKLTYDVSTLTDIHTSWEALLQEHNTYAIGLFVVNCFIGRAI